MPFQRTLLFVLAVFAATYGHAQYWAKSAGGTSNDAYTDMVLDAAGNAYVTGEFGGIMQLNPGSITTYGSLDAIVAKYDANGALVWARHFGGPGLDRGIALKLGSAGQLVVVGQFMGTATFGDVQLVSLANTQDVFVLSLDATTGDVQWVRQGGSADGVDQPSGVSIGPSGVVAVTGEFRGTAVFDGGTITSMTDPVTEEPSVDIFIHTYAMDGTPGWLKHGAAAFADRGVDVEHDIAGNLYVTGMFSDTIAFDQVYTNAMYSAVFLMRFDAQGNEEWFRVFGGGTYNQVFDLLLVEDERLLLVGDLQGTVIYQDAQPDIFTAVAPRSSFLLEIDLDGELLQRTTWGSAHDMSTRAVAASVDEIAVFGRFSCQMTGFSALYDEGLFLASGPQDLYIARFQLSDLAFKEAQQFGGVGGKAVGGVGYAADGMLRFSGAFEEALVFPADPSFVTTPSPDQYWGGYGNVPYCGDEDYYTYAVLDGAGLRDAFIASGYVDGRQPYDFVVDRSGSCDRPLPIGWIGHYSSGGVVGPDSVVHCGPMNIVVRTNTTGAMAGDELDRTAPILAYEWMNGSTSDYQNAAATGWYHVTIRSIAGCWEVQDSLHVTIHPIPSTPLISDDEGVNVEAISTMVVEICSPEEVWLWATGVDPENELTWTGNGQTVVSDSILATASGYYNAQVISPFGCEAHNTVEVLIRPNEPLEDLVAEFELIVPQDTDQNDTVTVCPNEPVTFLGEVSLFLNGAPVPLPYGVAMLYRCQQGWNISYNGEQVSCYANPVVEGWVYRTVEVALTNAPCGTDTLFFMRSDSVYVIPTTIQAPMISLTGPPILCPGDTAELTWTCVDCQLLQWNISNLISTTPNGFLVSGAGYSVIYTQVTNDFGCTLNVQASHVIDIYPRPLLGNFPNDAIICPDSVALVFSDTPGLSYQWYGPLGPMAVDNDTIATSQPGEYYLEMVDMDGCAVVSDNILITDYATPYLNVLPDAVLCEPDETAELQVVTTGAASLVWAAPLSGNSLIQVVDEPGTYTCSVSACGIVTPLSVVIMESAAQAELTAPGPYTMCEGSSVELQATSGQGFYLWEPGQVLGPVLVVDAPGIYTLMVTDLYGCGDTLQVVVNEVPVAQPVSASAGPVCLGNTVVFNGQGEGALVWYADPNGTNLLGTGTILNMASPPGIGPYTVYVQQDIGACTSALVAVTAVVYPQLTGPVITAPDSVCLGATAELAVDEQLGGALVWTTPAGTAIGALLVLQPFTLADTGAYAVLVSNPGCSVQGPPHQLSPFFPMRLDLGPDTVFCEGGAYILQLPANFTSPQWTTGATGSDITVTEPGIYGVTAMDEQGCIVTASVQLDVVPCDPLLPNVITPNGDGTNDQWSLDGLNYRVADLRIFNRNGDLVWQGDPRMTAFKGDHSVNGEPLSAGVYYYVLSAELYVGQEEEAKGYLHLFR